MLKGWKGCAVQGILGDLESGGFVGLLVLLRCGEWGIGCWVQGAFETAVLCDGVEMRWGLMSGEVVVCFGCGYGLRSL